MMTYALFFLSGCFLGLSLAFALTKHSKSFRELQSKLTEKEAEYARYQDHVAEHFQKTAELFSEVQARQDILVNHLQEGAKHLRGEMLETHETVLLTDYDPEKPRDYPVQS